MTAAVPDPRGVCADCAHINGSVCCVPENCAAVPDPRFRDQLAGWLFDFTMRHKGSPWRWASPDLTVSDLSDDLIRRTWRAEADRLIDDVLTAEVEARVQAAANQRAAVVGRCGNCDAITDTLPCPFCATGSRQRAHSLAQEVHRLRADGKHATATRLIRTALDAAEARGRAAALAPPAPAPQPSGWEDRRRRGFDCPTCEGTGRTFHHDMPDGSVRAQQCLTCGGTGKAPAPAAHAKEGQSS